MNTFDIMSGADVKEQMEKLHDAVTSYINHIKETNEKSLESNGVDIDKILSTLGDIKAKLIDALSSKKASNYVLHAVNVVYNFDAFLNPIATAVVTYAIRQLYINKIGLEIISNVNNVIKCVCMDMIARSKSNRSLEEVSNMAKDYHMTYKDVMTITQKYVDARDTQVMQMLDQTIERDRAGFEENLKSADELISAFSQNDKWVAEWGVTCKAVTLQSANNLCLKIRKDMGSYITAMSTCLDRHVIDNIAFNEKHNYYDERAIDAAMRENDRKMRGEEAEAEKAAHEEESLYKEGKRLASEINIKSYEDYTKLDKDDKSALNAYWRKEKSAVPDSLRFMYDKDRYLEVLKNIEGSISISTTKNNKKTVSLSKSFFEYVGDDNYRLYMYDTIGFHYRNDTESYIASVYKKLAYKHRFSESKCPSEYESDIISSYEKIQQYIKVLNEAKRYNK